MDKNEIVKKYGKDYVVDVDTFHMGVHRLLSAPIADRFAKFNSVLDACVGAGFMSIAIAKNVQKVIAVDTDKIHLEQAKQNAKIENVDSKIIFINGDILKELNQLENFDAAFLDPDWARPGDEKTIHVMELKDMEPSGDILLEQVSKKTKNICLRLPKEFDLSKLNHFTDCEIQAVYLEDKLKFYCVYFGGMVEKKGMTELRA